MFKIMSVDSVEEVTDICDGKLGGVGCTWGRHLTVYPNH